MSEINLIGLASNLDGEDRALAYLEVNHNNTIYNWQVFIPKSIQNIQIFIDSINQSILDDIDAKELSWLNLDPKTRTEVDPVTGQETQISISKEEIVKPSIPDYYALRRNEYPTLGDQLDAMWKGPNSQAYTDMQNKIASIKAKYPKS